MKNAKKILNGWFWAWLIIAVLMVVGMLVVGNQKATRTMASVIMATMMVLPVRNWAERFLVWAIEYISSRRQTFRNKVNKLATMNLLVDPSKRVENVGFYRSLRWGITVATVILALLWLVFQGLSFQVVYGFLHSWEMIFSGKVSWLAMLIILVTAVAFVWLVYRAIYWLLREVCLDSEDGHVLWDKAIWRICLFVGCFYGKIILDGILLKKTGSMIGATALLWTVVIALFLAIYFLIDRYEKRKKKEAASSSSDDSSSDDDSDDDDDDDDDVTFD